MARPRKHTDAEILATAREIFLEQGASASLDRVAERLGMTQPALFRRFGTKERLLLLALAPPPADWLSLVTAGPSEAPMPDQLRTLCVGALAFLCQLAPAVLTLRAAGPEVREAFAALPDGGPRRAHAALLAFFTAAQRRGQLRRADPEAIAAVLIGTLEARAMRAWLVGQPLDEAGRRAFCDAVVDVLWRGLAADEADELAGAVDRGPIPTEGDDVR